MGQVSNLPHAEQGVGQVENLLYEQGVGQVGNLPHKEAMNTLKYKKQYRRRLLHIQPPGATFFITFRLADSIPSKVWKELRERMEIIYSELADELADEQASALERERLWFQEYEEQLHNTRDGPVWLKDERIAALVAGAFHHLDGDRYRLDAFCVMPNHAHVVLMPFPTTEAGKAACLTNQLVKDPNETINNMGQVGNLPHNSSE